MSKKSGIGIFAATMLLLVSMMVVLPASAADPCFYGGPCISDESVKFIETSVNDVGWTTVLSGKIINEDLSRDSSYLQVIKMWGGTQEEFISLESIMLNQTENNFSVTAITPGTFRVRILDLNGILRGEIFFNSPAPAPTPTPIPNHPPVAIPQSVTLNEGTSKTFTLNASDPDGDVLIFSALDNPAHGTLILSPNGTATYTSAVGFSGTEKFNFSVSDGMVSSEPAMVTINVVPMCWDGANKYLLYGYYQIAKFNRCAAGAYQYGSPIFQPQGRTIVKYTTFQYINTDNNAQWSVRATTSISPVIAVKINGALYYTNQTYYSNR